MFKSKVTVFLILLLLSLSFIIFNKSGPVLTIKNYLSEILRPSEIIFSKVGNGFLFWRDAILNIKHLKDLNAKLTSENLELYGKLAKLSQVEEENALLNEKLNLSSKNSWNIILTRVIGRDFNNNRSFLIDKGSKDGLVDGMPVIITGGVVIGKTSDVNFNTSKVITTIDVQSKITAITSSDGTSGLVRGLGSDLTFDLIDKNRKPKIGDLIISSGIDGLLPRGLVIGKIKQIRSGDNQVFNTADIELLANFRDINDVFVIINFTPLIK